MAADQNARIRQLLTRRCAARGIPVSGTFELTPRCNLQCKMCYVRLTPEQMAPIGRERTAEEWIELGREAREAGMAFLLITGGEPTIRPDFPVIYEALAQMGFSISINTNGTLLSPKLREVFHKWPPSLICITLYGVCREDYEQLCGNSAAYDALLNTLEWLKKDGILVRLNTTITSSNQHKWMEFETFAKEHGLELRLTSYCFPPVRRMSAGPCLEFDRLPPEDAAEVALKHLLYHEGMDELRRRAKKKTAPVDSECSLDVGDPIRCMAGRSQFWVTWDGRMIPCGMLEYPAVTLVQDGRTFLEKWEDLRGATKQIRLCPDCANCEIRNTCLNCAAVTYTETGSYSGKPEYMCQFNKAYLKKLAEMTK